MAAADKLDNVRAILADHWTRGPSIWTRFNAAKADQQWFYRGCATALAGGVPALIRELDLVVQDLEQL